MNVDVKAEHCQSPLEPKFASDSRWCYAEEGAGGGRAQVSIKGGIPVCEVTECYFNKFNPRQQKSS